jgi:ERCC4-type nuclease
MIVESREPSSNWEKIQKESPSSTKEFFECGDYLLPCGYGIERKKGRDFLGSLLSKRLYEQLINLCQYEHPILAVISDNIWKDFYYSQSRYIHNVYLGTLSTVTAKFPQVRILQFEDDDQFIAFLVSLEKKLLEEGGDKERPKPFARRATSLEDRKENCLAQIEGVGIKMAQKLLKEYGSINKIAQATEEALQEMDKLGKKTAKNIVETLN